MKRDNALLSAKLSALIKLTGRKLVGVKLVYSKKDFDKDEAKELTSPLEYCVVVKSATLGNSLKLRKQCSQCSGSTFALGFSDPGEGFYSGCSSCELGLFKDPEVAFKTNNQLKYLHRPLYGVIVKPFECFTKSDPDVVLIVANPRELMRVMQGYTCHFGIYPHIALTGNQAVCIESTTTPIITDQINLSMFCSGTRYLAKWKDTEAIAGVPYDKIEGLIQGLLDTVRATEMDDRKKEIIADLGKLGVETSCITMDDAYYLLIEREKIKNRKTKSKK